MHYVLVLFITFLLALFKPMEGSASPALREALEREVIEYRLPNGMRWLFVRRPGAPVFTGIVQVKVGGIEEAEGRTGLAHMFEHMAFKGTREIGTTDFPNEAHLLARLRQIEAAIQRASGTEAARLRQELTQVVAAAGKYVAPNELWHLFHKNGAEELNAFTGKDLTGYYAQMPTNMLGLWTYLTAEMIGFPILREFYPERSVVMEERRSSVEASPRGQLYEALLRTAFTRSPYRWMTIGSMADLEHLTLTDAEVFHATYYRPDRMVGAIVGAIDVAEARAVVQRYFGRLPARPSPPVVRAGEEAVQTAERRVAVPFDAKPLLMIGYHKPALPDRDDYVFDLLTAILCDGMTSRLERRLVQTTRVARSVDCDSALPGSRLGNLFVISAEPIAPHTPRDCAAIIEEELLRLRTAPVSPDELAKARTNIAADFLWGISTSEGLAQQLVYFQTIAGDWRYITRHGAMIQRITAADIQRVAQKYLVPTNRTVAELVKK